MRSERSYRGESKESFADAAKKAVEKAEKHFEDDDAAPTEYEITLCVTATPGSSLSEYVVYATPPA